MRGTKAKMLRRLAKRQGAATSELLYGWYKGKSKVLDPRCERAVYLKLKRAYRKVTA